MVSEPDAFEFAKLAETLQAAPTPTSTAQEIVDYVRELLDANHAGLTLIRSRDRLDTIAATGPLVEQADRLQYELNEGPCRDSSWHRQTLISEDLANDPRWPRWAAKVSALGMSSIVAAELTSADRHRIGAINVYWTHPRTITADDAAYVDLFARHAAIALSQSLNEADLNVAADTRKVIGQAEGILMERYDLDEHKAFAVLRRYSQAHNIKLRRIAEYLVANRQLPHQSVDDSPMGTDEPG